jgi:hypothetical protein
MTLGVNVIDHKTNKSLNENGTKYGILIDDTVQEIKNKIFVNTNNFYDETVFYYPNLTRLQVQDSKGIHSIKDNNCLLFYYSDLPETPSVVVISIFNIIVDNETYKGFNLEPYSLYMKFKQDDNYITDLYDTLVEEFNDLTQDDLISIIKMKMFNFNKSSSAPLISKSENDNLVSDIKQFFNTIKTRFTRETERYKMERDGLSEFYKKVYSYNSDKYYTKTTSGLPNFIYTTLNFTFHNTDYDSTISGRFIKLSQIFNLLELSDNIPLVAFNDRPRKDPQIKIYNRLIDTLNENSIKSWILNEKKKLKKASYKKIRGLMIKYRLDIQTSKPQNKYIIITITENGLINVRVNFEEDDNQRSIEHITEKVKAGINKVIDVLNKLHGVFSKSRRLQSTQDMISKLVSVNAILETDIRINTIKFQKMLNKYEASRIFGQKDIKDMISMYYTRFGKRDQDDDTERLGITVNVKDNPYKMNSSTIIIYGGYNLNQLKTIIDEIFILSEMSEKLKSNNIFDDSDSEDEIVIKERKQNVKKVRELGGKMSSITCQKKRQPKIDNETQIEDPELVMVYRGNKYICEGTGKHKYPGLSGDIPCCFEHPGKGMESIINKEILEIKVQPSNFIVNIQETISGTLKTFDAIVLKVTSEDVEGLDLSRSRYFYLDDNVQNDQGIPLVHIHNDDLIKRIEQDETNDKNETIWLSEVSLYQLISKPKKNTCLNIPHLHKRTRDDINAPCKHHIKEKTFGYNMKSYPCCFENKPPVYRAKRDDKSGVVKQHIITTDKLLGHKRQGVLQPGLNKLLNEIIEHQGGAFLRWGVNQNQLSFLNCIVESLSNKSDLRIDSTYVLKRYLTSYLLEHPDVFIRLNNGNISLKYGTIEEYTNAINSEDVIHWGEVIDLVQFAFECNILIIDIPHVETLSKTTFTYNDMRLVCNLNIHQDITKPYLLLIKKQNAFEIVVQNSSAIWNKSSDKIQIKNEDPTINFVFQYSTDKTSKSSIINFFVDYYKSSCVKETQFPESYPYEELYDAGYIIDKLQKTQHKIWFQLVNPFNKVNLLVTKLGLIVPIKETGKLDMQSVDFNDFISKQKTIGLDKVIELLPSFNKLDIQPKLQLLGITVKDGLYTGGLTNFGQTIPLKNDPIDPEIQIPILDSKFYYDVDMVLSGKSSVSNKEESWNNEISKDKMRIYDIKKEIGQSLVNDETTRIRIMEINKTPGLSKSTKIQMIKVLLSKYVQKDDTDLDFILDNISNEVTNDNIENLLLNNLVTTEKFNPDEVVKRTTESVWLNLNDIKKWFKKFSV